MNGICVVKGFQNHRLVEKDVQRLVGNERGNGKNDASDDKPLKQPDEHTAQTVDFTE